MGASRRSHPMRVIAALLVASSCGALGCGAVLGLDDGYPLEDAGDDGATIPDAVQDAILQDAIVRGEGGGTVDSGGEACPPDPTYCYTHCGPGKDSCGHSWSCLDNCPTAPGWSCSLTTNTCACSDPGFSCTGLCGTATDTCGASHECPSCDAGGCQEMDTCGAGQVCGFAMSCGQTIPCGSCAPPGICEEEAGTCCTPVADPCGNQCGVTLPVGCGLSFQCPTCPTPDSGPPIDSGTPHDGGPTPDGGTSDAGQPDVGGPPADGGQRPDGGGTCPLTCTENYQCCSGTCLITLLCL